MKERRFIAAVQIPFFWSSLLDRFRGRGTLKTAERANRTSATGKKASRTSATGRRVVWLQKLFSIFSNL